ncbi:aspartyl-phosphate phosphatase Spo0E family protein [Tumebacillus sp. DT12]|uniref:Aspartyl-phosphate phosphatase Spo0E family protein n=1 Tax=Tumebacillus lacus TaxID=2995335 RepID=A0ABT3WYN9_9BACL|nr:aspartyl-phosphate phosphatase Spo0E family protein [Tumebacillus lacus]MCX7569784.1 aspartyl-phosphate phosphatase Spo0E family protein [Tumebacillus lacus]
MYISCITNAIELLRRELNECACHKQGNLLDKEVIAISQALDVLLVARYKDQKAT